MISTFKCGDTEKIYLGQSQRKFPPEILSAASRKLRELNAAVLITDLRTPGNNLELLKRDRAGQHSIRINRQYRICFQWVERNTDGSDKESDKPEPGDAYDVEIVDYH